MVANLNTGLAGQIMISTNALHAPTTPVTVDYAIEFETESVADSLPVLQKQGIAGTLFSRSGRVRPIDTGMAAGDTVHTLLNTGYARLLRHCFGGYVFSWPGSTNGLGTLTLAAVATNNDTMTIEGQVYTFKTALTASTTANEILVASSIALQASYIAAAINRGVASDGRGSGVAYGSLTPRNVDVTAVANPTTVVVTDRQGRGDTVNSGGANEVATTETFTNAGNVWGAATLASGANGTDTRRLHTFTVDAASLRELMATLQIVRPASSSGRVPFTYVGKPVSFNLACAMDDAMMLTPTWDTLSRTTATAAASPTYPASAQFFDYTEIAVTVGGTAEPVQGVNVTVETMQQSRGQFGAATRRLHLIMDRPTITGELTREFENSDIYNDWISGTEASVIMTATGNLIPSSASAYQAIITIPDILYEGSTPNIGGPGVVGNNIPFRGLDNGTDPPITLQYYTDEAYVGDDG